MEPDFTAREFAALAGVHVETVRRLAREGCLSGAYKIGLQWRLRDGRRRSSR